MQRQRLTLLSYNIQAGLTTSKYSHYLTQSWKQVVPVPSRMGNLDGISRVIADYDIVGLQEVDTGSLRSGFLDQARYMGERAGFPHIYDQSNRRIGRISQHSNALMSRHRPNQIEYYKLPGVLPGRGVLWARFGFDGNVLDVFVLHMALGRRGRLRQMEFLADLIRGCEHAVVMGDLNARSDSPEMLRLLERASLREPRPGLHTFPSWAPDRQLDHILVSPSIDVDGVEVLPYLYSDHLPIAMRVSLPAGVQIDA